MTLRIFGPRKKPSRLPLILYLSSEAQWSKFLNATLYGLRILWHWAFCLVTIRLKVLHHIIFDAADSIEGKGLGAGLLTFLFYFTCIFFRSLVLRFGENRATSGSRMSNGACYFSRLES
ncbi:hypothetical protein L228DRAFT_181068 [Xylona heveae TC161]|uniref:Uncharacterized protein n=1 Tax=Xylona heveae (strain CBS 132557 / TC161) TaxID=1328760 RepID=A0A165FE65_XYLHT|nr:hypothetical protein L228DRAFT_181068 [Xylona heveae TC161]KZF20876.1 hypothetical protein L228DRAFT_181068 [Xylona heveae TC161]